MAYSSSSFSPCTILFIILCTERAGKAYWLGGVATARKSVFPFLHNPLHEPARKVQLARRTSGRWSWPAAACPAPPESSSLQACAQGPASRTYLWRLAMACSSTSFSPQTILFIATLCTDELARHTSEGVAMATGHWPAETFFFPCIILFMSLCARPSWQDIPVGVGHGLQQRVPLLLHHLLLSLRKAQLAGKALILSSQAPAMAH